MNFLKFVNSKDIRGHLEKIGYECTPLEAAWLVYQNRTATLEERHAAWQEIIDTMPDCSVETRDSQCSSLHAFLRDYISMEHGWI